MGSVFTPDSLAWWMQLFGDAFVAVSVIGLVVGVFETAFHQVASMHQLWFRIVLHVIGIPVGVYLRTLHYVKPAHVTLGYLTRMQLSSSFIAVGAIGLIIAAVELGIVHFRTNDIYFRISIYIVALVLGVATTVFESQ